MKKVILFVLCLTLMLGSISFAKGGGASKFYPANKVSRYDLDGDQKPDRINFICDGVDYPVLYINRDMFTFRQASSELFLDKFKIVDLDKSDKFSEIAVSFAVPPHDNLIAFYRYTPSGGHYVGDISGKLQDISSNIKINGDGTIINTIHSDLVKGASYKISYRLSDKNKLVQTSRDDIYYYQKRLQKTIKGNMKFYKSINSDEYTTFDSAVKATFLGEVDGWVWVDVKGDIYWLKGKVSSQEDNNVALKSYDEIYLEEGLLSCITYFDNNYDKFTPEARNLFAFRISREIDKRGREYSAVNDIEAASTPAPPTIGYINSLYPDIYDGETNTLKLAKLDSRTRETIKKIARDEVFMVTKAYYVMEENYEDSGFKLTIHPDIFTMLKKALDLTFDNKYGKYIGKSGDEVPGLLEISRPEEIVKASDRSWNSDAKYPEVLVEVIEKLDLLKGAWKTNAYIPVNIEGLKGSGDVSELKNYDQIYGEDGLLACINYFDANYDLFSEKARDTFAERISLAVNRMANKYSIANRIRHKTGAGPYTLENVNSLYPDIYDKDSNTLSLKGFDSDSGFREAIQQVKEDELFLLTKSYFVMEDVFNDNGFRLTIHPDTVKKLKRALDVFYESDSSKSDMKMYGLDAIAMPEELVTASDSSWSSDVTYPKVLVESPDKLKLLKGGWKVEIYLPVNIQEKSLDQPKGNNGSKLSDYTAEIINGTRVDYTNYTTVVVPMYDGANKGLLNTSIIFVGNNHTTDVNFAIFGKIENLKILHTNNGMTEEYKITKLGNLSNTLVTVKTEFPTDFANLMIKGHVKTGSGDYKRIEFTIDDMKNPEEYQPIMVK